jgi:hypothetical protein
VSSYDNANDFAAAVNAWRERQLPLIAKRGVARVVDVLTRHLQETTPVLTGHARSNWQTSIGDPAQGVIHGTGEATLTGQPQSADEKAASDRVLQEYVQTPDLERVYVTNNVHYIRLLNDGSSQKAPAGIVEVAIAATLEEVQSGRSG